MSRLVKIVSILCCLSLFFGTAVFAQTAPPESTDPVLARVGEIQIKQSEIDEFLSRIDPQMAIQFNSPEGRQRILEELVNQSLYYQWAIADQLDQNEDFQRDLESIRKNLLTQYAVETVFSDITVEDTAIEAYYEANSTRFTTPERIRASHILVDSAEEAETILAEIAGGLPFEEAASKYSDCPSREQGGDLGFFERGRMVVEFEDAAFALAINELSAVVESRFGFHIIKLTDRQSPGTRPLADVKEEIRQILTGQQQEALYREKLAELRERFEVVMFEE
ncbi:MAG TPA: peptidylprolyl isomerase [Atribacteraceae bacterium]|nr:peptidylprolyl isomerase [Atribacteraceae bacterium]